MNNENKIKKVMYTSLAGILFGSLFFIFGISIKSSILPLIINYILSMFLYISSFLAVHNNNKPKINLLSYIEYLSLFFIVFITIILVIEII